MYIRGMEFRSKLFQIEAISWMCAPRSQQTCHTIAGWNTDYKCIWYSWIDCGLIWIASNANALWHKFSYSNTIYILSFVHSADIHRNMYLTWISCTPRRRMQLNCRIWPSVFTPLKSNSPSHLEQFHDVKLQCVYIWYSLFRYQFHLLRSCGFTKHRISFSVGFL